MQAPSMDTGLEPFKQLMGDKPLEVAYVYGIHLGHNSACPNAQQFWAAKYLVQWEEGDEVVPVHQVLDWMTETGTIVQGHFHCPMREVLESLHDAMSLLVRFEWTCAQAADVYANMEEKKKEEVNLWAAKKQARPDTAMVMAIGQGLETWAFPATTTTTSSSSSSSNPPAVGSYEYFLAVQTSIRVDSTGLIAYATLFMKTDSTLTLKFFDHFIAAVLCPNRQERAVGLPKGWNSEKVPRPTPAVAAAQQEEERRWEGRDLAADRALMAEMRRLSRHRGNMTPEAAKAARESQRQYTRNMEPEALEKKRASQRVGNMEREALEKKRDREREYARERRAVKKRLK
ncbi:hypothetical protein B484DRAFT_401230 [Ochromonadaceae sp. CCMP2298]|nr:hypothetical protein B484DRAFT_401230 [Ochromonadaceae sp. CCMP2298]